MRGMRDTRKPQSALILRNACASKACASVSRRTRAAVSTPIARMTAGCLARSDGDTLAAFHRPHGRQDMRDVLFMARCDFVRGALALIIALLVMHPAAPAAAQAVSCTMTAAQIAAVAALPDPITRNAKGAYVRRGKAMDSDEVLDMCLTRRFYDLIVAREAAGGKIKFSEMGMSQPYYLTEREC